MTSTYAFTFAFLVWFSKVNCEVDFVINPKNGKATGIFGESVTLQWNITKNNETDKFGIANLVLLADSRRTLYNLDESEQKLVRLGAANVFGDRIDAQIKNGNTVQLTLQKLNYSDKNSFELQVLLLRGSESSTRKTAVIELNVVGRPKYCQDDLQSNYTFDVNDSSPTINITLCGVPQPVVEGHFIGKALIVTNSTVNDYTFNYTLQLPQLLQAACGKELTVTAEGYNDTLTNTTKIFVKNFIPGKVKKVGFSQNAGRDECNGTRRVQWQSQVPDTGSCSVKYTVEFRNNTNNILGIEENITTTFYCTSDYNDAKSVVVWATHEDIQGIKSNETYFKIKSIPTTSPTFTTSGNPTGEGNGPATKGTKSESNNTTIIVVVVVALVLVIAIVIVVIIIMKKKQKGGNVRSKKSQDDVVELKPPSYTDEGDYASVDPIEKKSAPENNQDQMLYAELGAGGGRKGPKSEPVESNYAQVKVDEMGYPARGPASDMSQPAPYPTSINRDRSRRHSPPPNYGEMDDDDGVIV